MAVQELGPIHMLPGFCCKSRTCTGPEGPGGSTGAGKLTAGRGGSGAFQGREGSREGSDLEEDNLSGKYAL